jgi:hypothetical protein
MFADFRVHGLNETGEAHPFSFPCKLVHAAGESIGKRSSSTHVRESREHGAPVQGARLVRKGEICRTTNLNRNSAGIAPIAEQALPATRGHMAEQALTRFNVESS